MTDAPENKPADAVALLPCPFCGVEPCSVPQNTDRRLPGGKGYYVSIWCVNCDGEGAPRTSGADAVEAWNRRVPVTPPDLPAAIREGIDALAGASYRLGCISVTSADKVRAERNAARARLETLIAQAIEGAERRGLERALQHVRDMNQARAKEAEEQKWTCEADPWLSKGAALAGIALMQALYADLASLPQPSAAAQIPKGWRLMPPWSNRLMREAMRRAVPSVPGDILDSALEAAFAAAPSAPVQSDAARVEKLEQALRAHEAWEADIVLNADWSAATPRLTQKQMDDLNEIQNLRNSALNPGGSDGR